MIIAMVVGLAAGIALGFVFDVTYPMDSGFYITMGLLAAMDSVVGAMRAHLEDKYNSLIFITGFIANAILAGIFAFVGDKLGIPLYYAVIFVFGGRMFNNLAVMRRIALDKYLAKKNKNEDEN